MEQGALDGCGFRQRQLVQSLLQQREHTATRGRAQCQSSFTGGFQALRSEALAEAEQAQTTAITHLRMRSVPEQVFEEIARVWANLKRPIQLTTGRPFHMGAVCFGHVLGLG